MLHERTAGSPPVMREAPSSESIFGALVRPGGVTFRLWAPGASRVDLIPESGDRQRLEPTGEGDFELFVPGMKAGDRYRYSLDGGEPIPDPASRFQPAGVHGPSQVVDPAAYHWGDGDWPGLAQRDLVFYELHVGTFTPEGTFRGVRDRLPYLRDLGVTAVELMPVADFPGRWNWGYDPAALYAPSRAYGTPDDLRDLVDSAHRLGLSVFLDVIYNHLGPDGAYIAAVMPLFSTKHETPWGQAVNLDDDRCEGVRRLLIDNALHWLREYHLDGLRLDAVHALHDDGEPHFLAELSAAVDALEGPTRYLVAEDERNLRTLLIPSVEGGYGLDAVWADDFHHQVRNITAGDAEGYFADFAGTTAADLAATLRGGWYFKGQVSMHQGRPRGTDPSGLAAEQFVLCIQNHDQVGNRPLGDRLHHQITPPLYRAASALLLFAPELPLLFMGQEWAVGTPFQFFTDHNAELGPLVSAGRRREFADFICSQGEVPDPQNPATFERSKLDWRELDDPAHAGTLRLYRDLLKLRKSLEGAFEVQTHSDWSLTIRRGRHHVLVALAADQCLPLPDGAQLALHTEQPEYAADGDPPRVEGGRVHFSTPAAAVCIAPGEGGQD